LQTHFESCYNNHNAILVLQEIADKITHRVIMSTIDSPKTVSQICKENKLPQSSTYKKIQKLQNYGLISIDKINIDSKGKKVAFYRSKIKSLEVNLNCDGILLQFNKKQL
jgi:predicted transcriptional regulator